MIKNVEIFENAPVPKAVFKFAVPTVLSMIVAVFYNMVDAFFVGLTNDPSKFAAVNVATPVFLFLMAAGNIYGMGGSSFLSRALGEKNYDKVKNIASFCFYAGIVTGVLGGGIMLFFMDSILHAVGTTETTYGFARDYLEIVALGGPLVVLSNAYTNLIRGEGAASSSMFGMMAGTVVNIVLDPIFILDELFGVKLLGMGVAGAAAATVIGNAVTLAFYICHIVSKNSVLTIKPKYFMARNGILTGVLTIGLPASLTNILMSLSAILTNKLLASYYAVQVEHEPLLSHVSTFMNGVAVFGDVPTAAMGVAMKANMLVIFVQLGLAIGISPLVGYNFGARNIKRMKSVMKFAILVNVGLGLFLTGIYFIFTRQIVNIFSNDAAVIDMGILMLHALMLSSSILGIMFVLNFTFQAMGKGVQSLILAVSRQGFIFLPLILILNKIVGLYGIIYAQPIADMISVLIAFGMFVLVNRELKKV